MDKPKVYVQKAPKGSEARYVVLDSEGRVIFAVANLGNVRQYYKARCLDVEIIRQLDQVYRPKKVLSCVNSSTDRQF